MRVLGLDISTKTGYAVLVDGVLTSYGLLTSPMVNDPSLASDFALLQRARHMRNLISNLILSEVPDMIVIEQTNQGSFRTDQKQLEFIHCLTLEYIRSTPWAAKTQYVDTSRWRSRLEIKLSKDQRKHNKAVKSKLARGKVTPKHLAVAWANEKYNLDLLKKDHDIADGICLATYGWNEENRKAALPPGCNITVEEALASLPKSMV